MSWTETNKYVITSKFHNRLIVMMFRSQWQRYLLDLRGDKNKNKIIGERW